ncbi:MAG: hypothetical protein JWM82_3022, partial [Myxococcales bacterium]|nr:hypothetical protein [Myxococcales bacterium]
RSRRRRQGGVAVSDQRRPGKSHRVEVGRRLELRSEDLRRGLQPDGRRRRRARRVRWDRRRSRGAERGPCALRRTRSREPRGAADLRQSDPGDRPRRRRRGLEAGHRRHRNRRRDERFPQLGRPPVRHRPPVAPGRADRLRRPQRRRQDRRRAGLVLDGGPVPQRRTRVFFRAVHHRDPPFGGLCPHRAWRRQRRQGARSGHDDADEREGPPAPRA